MKQEAFEHSGLVTASKYIDGRTFDLADHCLFSVVGSQVNGISRGMWFETFETDMLVASAFNPFILKTSSLINPCALNLT